MKDALNLVLEGRLSWDHFFHQTRDDWSRLARERMRRWRLPAGICEEDVAQELKIAAFRAAAEWDPGGMPFDRFVIWRAVNAASKWIHTQRKAKRRDGKAQSRIAIPFSEFEVEPEETTEAEQEATVERFERIGSALNRLDEASQHVLVAIMLARGDLDGAAEDVYDDRSLRRTLRLDSVEHARRIVKRVAGEAIDAMAA